MEDFGSGFETSADIGAPGPDRRGQQRGDFLLGPIGPLVPVTLALLAIGFAKAGPRNLEGQRLVRSMRLGVILFARRMGQDGSDPRQMLVDGDLTDADLRGVHALRPLQAGGDATRLFLAGTAPAVRQCPT